MCCTIYKVRSVWVSIWRPNHCHFSAANFRSNVVNRLKVATIGVILEQQDKKCMCGESALKHDLLNMYCKYQIDSCSQLIETCTVFLTVNTGLQYPDISNTWQWFLVLLNPTKTMIFLPLKNACSSEIAICKHPLNDGSGFLQRHAKHAHLFCTINFGVASLYNK